MNEELKSIFNLCDIMINNCDIDYNLLRNKHIDKNFFKEYDNTRIVNSFLFTFSKLQDKIGAKLFRKTLYELKEIDDIAIPMIDVLNLLEKLKIIDAKSDWDELREIRNTLAHEYPFALQERVENITLALNGYELLKNIYNNLKASI